MKLYIAATPDKYELPMIVADSAVELARRCGMDVQKLHREIQRGKTRKGKFFCKGTKYCFFMVEVPDDD